MTINIFYFYQKIPAVFVCHKMIVQVISSIIKRIKQAITPVSIVMFKLHSKDRNKRDVRMTSLTEFLYAINSPPVFFPSCISVVQTPKKNSLKCQKFEVWNRTFENKKSSLKCFPRWLVTANQPSCRTLFSAIFPEGIYCFWFSYARLLMSRLLLLLTLKRVKISLVVTWIKCFRRRMDPKIFYYFLMYWALKWNAGFVSRFHSFCLELLPCVSKLHLLSKFIKSV